MSAGHLPWCPLYPRRPQASSCPVQGWQGTRGQSESQDISQTDRSLLDVCTKNASLMLRVEAYREQVRGAGGQSPSGPHASSSQCLLGRALESIQVQDPAQPLVPSSPEVRLKPWACQGCSHVQEGRTMPTACLHCGPGWWEGQSLLLFSVLYQGLIWLLLPPRGQGLPAAPPPAYSLLPTAGASPPTFVGVISCAQHPPHHR